MKKKKKDYSFDESRREWSNEGFLAYKQKPRHRNNNISISQYFAEQEEKETQLMIESLKR